jgi:hypothetical protein
MTPSLMKSSGRARKFFFLNKTRQTWETKRKTR